MTTDRPTQTDRPIAAQTGSSTPTGSPIDLDSLTLADVRAGTLRD